MTRPYRTAAILSNFIGLVILSSLGTYYSFFEKPWLAYMNLPLPPVTPTAPAGKAIGLLVKRCSTDSNTRVYSLTRTLVSDDGGPDVLMPASSAAIKPGCSAVQSDLNIIPLCTTPGKKHIEGVSEIHGTYRTFLVKWYSAPFIVTEALNNEGATCKP